MQINPTSKKILFSLKSKGPQTAKLLGNELEITSMGARQYLQDLESNEYVTSFYQSEGVGRPKLYWKLTEKADQFFPDTHAYLTTEIIVSIKNSLGKNALEKVIEEREKQSFEKYKDIINKYKNLEQKVIALAEIRSHEGYMATAEKQSEQTYWLIENHCPICAAAKTCEGFCKSELNLFQSLFPKNISIKRVSHILSGQQRCVYEITSA